MVRSESMRSDSRQPIRGRPESGPGAALFSAVEDSIVAMRSPALQTHRSWQEAGRVAMPDGSSSKRRAFL